MMKVTKQCQIKHICQMMTVFENLTTMHKVYGFDLFIGGIINIKGSSYT